MAQLNEIINYIEEFAPLYLQGRYDNCGLKLGNRAQEITGILVTLDTNYSVVEEAIKHDCNLIIEHHPTIFGGIKNLNYELPLTKAMMLAIKNDIAIYSAHTNFDFCQGGLNDYVASIMGIEDAIPVNNESSPRIGNLKEETTLSQYAEFLKELFNDNNVCTIGDLNKKIKRVAVVNGGGGGHDGDMLATMRAGADVFVTGDVKYNVARLAKDAGYAIIQVGHYNSEMKPFLTLMSKLLREKYNEVNIIESTSLVNPYN